MDDYYDGIQCDEIYHYPDDWDEYDDEGDYYDDEPDHGEYVENLDFAQDDGFWDVGAADVL